VDGDGYVVNGPWLDLSGYTFTQGTANVVVVYTAGAAAVDTSTIPAAPGPYTYTATAPTYSSTLSVTIAGVTATVMAGTPTVGRYAVTSAGVYTFAAADAGKAIVVTYGILPPDIEQATIEHVALRYRNRPSAGLGSQSVGGESVTYSDAGTFAFITGVLDGSIYKTPAVA
jgi:hypothetical protein